MPVIVVPKTLRDIQTSRPLVVAVVFAALMLDVMLMTSIDPILPAMMEELYGNTNSSLNIDGNISISLNETHSDVTTDKESIAHAHALEVGVLVAAKPGTEILSNLVVGVMVDRIGHRYPMLLGSLFNFLGTVGFSYGQSFVFLLLCRIMQAVGSSLSVVSGLAFLASVFTDDVERAKASSKAFCGISLGVMLGYPYGSSLYQWLGRAPPFLILAALCLTDGALRMILVSPPSSEKRVSSAPSSRYMILLSDPYILVGLGCSFLIHFDLGVFLATGPTWMIDVLHAQQWTIGVVLAIPVVFHLIAQFITGLYSVRFGRWVFCMVGMIIFGFGIATYPLCTNIWEVIGPEATVRIGHGTVLCVISPLLGHIADVRHDSNYGSVYGLYTASYNIGLSVGPLSGGYLIKILPFRWIYWVIGITTIVISFFCISFKNTEPRPDVNSNILKKADVRKYGSIDATC